MDLDRPAHPDRTLAAVWDADRAHLLRLAGRLLRDPGEAEDVVQEAFGRLAKADIDQIDDVRGWLAVVVRRLCLDRLRSARSRRETAASFDGDGAAADAPMQMTPAPDPADRVTLDEQVQMALVVVLDRLSPPERTAFVLHDVFGFPFDAIAEIVGRTPAACRQLASRARRSIRDGAPPDRVTAPSARYEELTGRFIAAFNNGDIDGLVSVLDPMVSGHSSIVGGRSLGHFEGRDVVLEQFARRFRLGVGDTWLLPTMIESDPALLVFDGSAAHAVVVLHVADGLVQSIRSYVRPH
jgi:RNA polymerase sigma-70 factor (ECF subfamily)